MGWLADFSASARGTDKFRDRDPAAHRSLLAAGLAGEAGSILAEFKKEKRERDAYPAYRKKMIEEIGDFLWYFARLVDMLCPDLVEELESVQASRTPRELPVFLDLGAAVGDLLSAVLTPGADGERERLRRVWGVLRSLAQSVGVDLRSAGNLNVAKTVSRWPDTRDYHPLFDEGEEEEEQLPRHLEIEFRERTDSPRKAVYLRYKGLNFGDRLSDNVEGQDDGYRFHDIFHFAYAVHLGWSPVMRQLLKVKRKSKEAKDEGQDGARALIVEEAVSAIVFSRAKHMNLFDLVDHVDYDLLKTIQEFVRDFEVSAVALWQWEHAILEGFAMFRLLKHNGGGTVTLNLADHKLEYRAPTK